ncbi:hypothetical protein AmaxDRAFT_1869 [Limnospira maxima CS-328]|uniref:Uncharacterized protein n=1 Tax=Limnospira maxima CS-328 TaxID=513049 RepID=B5VZP3_LIMMA|nr:hypothetical protein AmaxDRAFT_1869 [Limnospira maxima CS-328]
MKKILADTGYWIALLQSVQKSSDHLSKSLSLSGIQI